MSTLQLLLIRFEELNQATREGRSSLEPEVLVRLQGELTAVTTAINTLREIDRKAENEAQRLAEWQNIVPICRRKLEDVRALARKFENARKAYESAINKLNHAEFALTEHRKHAWQPSQFPTSEELQEEAVESKRLEESLEGEREQVRKTNEERGSAQMAALKASREFDVLAAQERRLRPAEKNPRPGKFAVQSIA